MRCPFIGILVQHGRTYMPKIWHIAIASDHPGKAAEFFKQAFEFEELNRFGLDPAHPEQAACPSGVFSPTAPSISPS
jgi:hypothetical protein